VKPTFFATPDEFRAWLERNHADADELLVGFHKKGSGRPSIDWPQSVREALCFGWIDGVRRSLDDERYTIRFTPRRRGSIWSAVNVRTANELIEAGLMRPAGLAAFEARSEKRSGVYSYEQRKTAAFDPEQERSFRADAAAWEFFQAQPAGYRRTATWWVVSGKREETRARRLTRLIEDSAAGLRLAHLVSPGEARRRREQQH
jgi:uncharacterized protein YdeI (YjbR/CyaY-like superfamily)